MTLVHALAVPLIAAVVALAVVVVVEIVQVVRFPEPNRGKEIHGGKHHCALPVVTSIYPETETIGRTFVREGWDLGDQFVCAECLCVWQVQQRWPGSPIWEWSLIEQGAGKLT